MNNSLNLKQAFETSSAHNVTKPKKRQSPFSMRFTDSERDFLGEHSGSLSWASYIRKCVFDDKAAKPRRPVKQAVPDTALLAQVLYELGASRLSANINQLAKPANMGTLDVSPETVREIETACREIHTMRMLLIAALGIKPEDGE